MLSMHFFLIFKGS